MRTIAAALLAACLLASCESPDDPPWSDGRRVVADEPYLSVVDEQIAYLEAVFGATPAAPIVVNVQPGASVDKSGVCQISYQGDPYYAISFHYPSYTDMWVCSPNPVVIRHEVMHAIIRNTSTGHLEFFNGIRVADHVAGWTDV